MGRDYKLLVQERPGEVGNGNLYDYGVRGGEAMTHHRTCRPVSRDVVTRALWAQKAGEKMTDFARDMNVNLTTLRKAMAERKKEA